MSFHSVYRLVGNRAAARWIILICATAVSFVIAVDHGTGSLVAVAVLAIGAVKARLIGLDFMELRDAPIPLRAIFETYCLLVWAVLAGLYLWL
jgi:hypothetical protein